MSVEQFVILTNQLYPDGRAFKMAEDSTLRALHEAIAEGESEGLEDVKNILDIIIPDNTNFTTDDATDWERRLGILINPDATLADRKAAILRKMAFPGNVAARGSAAFIEGELRKAGFDVYVHANVNAVAPETLYSGSFIDDLQHGDAEHGEQEHGGLYTNIVANSIDPEVDKLFNIGANFRCTFFVGGPNVGDYASIPAAREVEFRQLLLRLKHTQTIAFIFINYV